MPNYETILQMPTSNAKHRDIIVLRNLKGRVPAYVCVCVEKCQYHLSDAEEGYEEISYRSPAGMFFGFAKVGRSSTQAIHTVGHFSVRLYIYFFFLQNLQSWGWQRMSARLLAIAQPRRENQQCPQKLYTVIGARLEQGFQIRGINYPTHRCYLFL